jgi:hypothetical protein
MTTTTCNLTTTAEKQPKTRARRTILRPNYRDNTILRWSYEEAMDYSGYTRGTLWTMASRGRFLTYKHGFFRVDRVSFEQYLTEKK